MKLGSCLHVGGGLMWENLVSGKLTEKGGQNSKAHQEGVLWEAGLSFTTNNVRHCKEPFRRGSMVRG